MKESLIELKRWLDILIAYELDLIYLGKYVNQWLGKNMPMVMAIMAIMIIIFKIKDFLNAIFNLISKMFKSKKRRRKRKRKKKKLSLKRRIRSFI